MSETVTVFEVGQTLRLKGSEGRRRIISAPVTVTEGGWYDHYLGIEFPTDPGTFTSEHYELIE